MSIFGNIASAIFGKGKASGRAPLAPGPTSTPAPQGTATVGGAPATGNAMTEPEVEGDDQEDRRRPEPETQLATPDCRLDEAIGARTQLPPPANSSHRNSATKGASTVRPT